MNTIKAGISVIVGWALAVNCFGANLPPDVQEKVNRILEETGTTGGIIVHLGCGDGTLTAAFGAAGNFLVHGLDGDPQAVAQARRNIESKNMYGRVSIDQLGERLPYIDGLVNLVYSDDSTAMPQEEILRVLVPGGVACLREGAEYVKIIKPAVESTDDWTHYMHDSTGNAVANDTVVTPPKYLKWTCGPIWSRSHSHMGSTMSLVAANGRIFSIIDEGYEGKDQYHAPPGWSLLARDAYNGILLWRKPIARWHDSFWNLKSGPAQLPERIVADADRVYVTLDIDGPVSALDAATGDVVFVCGDSAGTEEVLLNNGTLFLLRNPERAKGDHREPVRRVKGDYRGTSPYGEYPKEIMAVDAKNGKVIWKKETPVVATTLAADDRQVCFHNGERVVCLDGKTGQERWRTEEVVDRIKPVPANLTPTLVMYKDIVAFAAGRGETTNGKPDLTSVFNGDTGKLLWTAPQEKCYSAAPFGLFIINDIVWTGDVSGGGPGPGGNPYTGRDMYSGKVVKTFTRDVHYLAYHSRCYRNKATVNYILPNIRGVELVDIHNECWDANTWARGGCSFGIMPANGMIYTTPHPCSCYTQSKLTGFNALYGDGMRATAPSPTGKQRLVKGPAYTAKPVHLDYDGDWPVFRHDNDRSSYTRFAVEETLEPQWRVSVGQRLSTMTIAGGISYVASVDEHTVHAIDTASGKKLWSYIAGARIDSPPTIYQGRAYFGNRDGYVYCLDASDGSLIWRFLCAPEDRRLSAYSQLESVHPVNGSVLIQDDVLYCVAGRSMFLDTGLRLYRLDAETGEELSVNVMDGTDPFTGTNLQEKILKQTAVPSMPDILSCDGKHIYMGSQQFDLAGKRTEIVNYVASQTSLFELQQEEGSHLFTPAGFLDDARYHRNYWIYGKAFLGGHQDGDEAAKTAPAGSILACNETDVFGFLGSVFRIKLQNSLFSMSKTRSRQRGGIKGLEYLWTAKSPIYVNSLVIADKTLLAAGSSDADQNGYLYLYSIENGKQIAEYPLEAPPVFDGMACAKGAICVALKDGSVACFK